MVVTSLRLSSSVLSAIRFVFLDVTCFIAENVFSHTYLLPDIESIFRVKSFSLRNLSLLTSVWKLSTLCDTVSIVHFISKDVMFVLIKITYCRDGQLLWFEGHS